MLFNSQPLVIEHLDAAVVRAGALVVGCCGHHGGWRVADGRYKCASCGSRTSVTAGTLFDRRRTPLGGSLRRDSGPWLGRAATEGVERPLRHDGGRQPASPRDQLPSDHERRHGARRHLAMPR